jgi:hypothetical protein
MNGIRKTLSAKNIAVFNRINPFTAEIGTFSLLDRTDGAELSCDLFICTAICFCGNEIAIGNFGTDGYSSRELHRGLYEIIGPNADVG